MATKREIGQRIMDLYYQQYKTNSDFFEIDDFVFQAGAAWGLSMQQEWSQKYAAERSEGNTDIFIGFDTDLQNQVILDVENKDGRYFSIIPDEIIPMSFKYDNQSTGIQRLIPLGASGCGELIRADIQTSWMDCYIPTSNKKFWQPSPNNQIDYSNLGTCNLKKVAMNYIPSGDMYDFNIPSTREVEIIQTGLQLMVAARNGKVIPRINDLDGNKVIEKEANIQPIG